MFSMMRACCSTLLDLCALFTCHIGEHKLLTLTKIQGPRVLDMASGSTVISSEAHFDERAKEVGLDASKISALKSAGFTNLGQVAYSIGQPGQPVSEDEFRRFMSNNFPTFNPGSTASFRRLVFEAQTLVVANLRLQVLDPDASSKARMPEAERDKRLSDLKARLTGVLIEGTMEPSRQLLQMCVQQESENQLRYIPPERATSRLFEVGSAKASTKQVEIEANKLVIREQSGDLSAPTFGALQVLEAFKRRGLAYAFAQLVTFEENERYLVKLFNHMQRDPPPGFLRCTIAQIVEADRLVWQRLIQDNVRPRRAADGSLPLDTSLMEALTSYETSFALMPLTKGGSKRKNKGKGKNADEQAEPNPKALRKDLGKSGSKNAKTGKGRGVHGFRKVPYAILQRNGTGETPTGEPICYDFVLSTCKNGEKCPKGKHVCPICYQPHALKDHPE